MSFSRMFLVYSGSWALSILLCLWLVPKLISLAHQKNWFDEPGERKVHKTPIPRLGGVAVFIATVSGLCLQSIVYYRFDENALLFLSKFLVPATMIFLLGLLDDIFNLRALLKLVAQVAIASFVFFEGVQVYGFAGVDLPPLLNFLVTVFWIVLFTNAYNLIDGFDGVASGLGIIAAIGIGGTLLMRGLFVESYFLLPLIGACMAFLRFNRSPARIFLGDSGSLFIGFTLAWISLVTLSKSSALASVFVPFLALGVPFFDVVLAVWRRTVRRYFYRLLDRPLPVGVMEADKEHLHHRLNSISENPRNVAATLYLINCLFVLTGILSLLYKELALGIFVLFFVVTAFLFVRYIGHVELAESRVVLNHGFAHTLELVKVNVLIAGIEFVLLCAIHAIAIWATYHWYRSTPQMIFLWKEDLVRWVFLIITGTSGLRMYYYIKNLYARPERMLAADFVFLLVLLSAVASVVTLGFTVDRIQASYFFSLAAVSLIVLRLVRFSYFEKW
jgi:UDP-N-acetylmuramyl pentapeptide phosphotransferase/UDP-N-acetylglucosamine-1-phosphate transferase